MINKEGLTILGQFSIFFIVMSIFIALTGWPIIAACSLLAGIAAILIDVKPPQNTDGGDRPMINRLTISMNNLIILSLSVIVFGGYLASFGGGFLLFGSLVIVAGLFIGSLGLGPNLSDKAKENREIDACLKWLATMPKGWKITLLSELEGNWHCTLSGPRDSVICIVHQDLVTAITQAKDEANLSNAKAESVAVNLDDVEPWQPNHFYQVGDLAKHNGVASRHLGQIDSNGELAGRESRICFDSDERRYWWEIENNPREAS